MKCFFPFPGKGQRGIRQRGAVTLSATVIVTFLAAAPAVSHPQASLPAVVTYTIIPAFTHDMPLSGTAHAIHQGSLLNASADPDFVCTVYASDAMPGNDNRTISGEGSQFCTGSGWVPQHIRVAIQWYLRFGFWSNRNRVSTNHTSHDFAHLTIGFPCTGTGTHTYRIVTDGYAANGAYSQSVQSQDYIRVTCHR